MGALWAGNRSALAGMRAWAAGAGSWRGPDAGAGRGCAWRRAGAWRLALAGRVPGGGGCAARRVRTSSPVPSGGARTPERRACHIGHVDPKPSPPGSGRLGRPCARAPGTLPAGAAPDPGRVLVIVDRYCPRAGSNDPRSRLTGFGPAGSQSVARWAGTGSNARHGNHTFRRGFDDQATARELAGTPLRGRCATRCVSPAHPALIDAKTSPQDPSRPCNSRQLRWCRPGSQAHRHRWKIGAALTTPMLQRCPDGHRGRD